MVPPSRAAGGARSSSCAFLGWRKQRREQPPDNLRRPVGCQSYGRPLPNMPAAELMRSYLARHWQHLMVDGPSITLLTCGPARSELGMGQHCVPATCLGRRVAAGRITRSRITDRSVVTSASSAVRTASHLNRRRMAPERLQHVSVVVVKASHRIRSVRPFIAYAMLSTSSRDVQQRTTGPL